MLTTWIMICHATGLANVLALGEFIRDVVHDTISKLGHTWQVAHELLMVYFEAVETSSDESVNIRTIFSSGSQDTYLKRAAESARHEYGSAIDDSARPRKGTPEKSGGDKWNGNFDKNSAKTCHSYNMGTNHPAKSLTEKGTCGSPFSWQSHEHLTKF